MVLFLAFFICNIMICVTSDKQFKRMKTKKEIQDYIQSLNNTNLELKLKLDSVKEKCDAELLPLQELQKTIETQENIQLNNLENLVSNLTQQRIEKELLTKTVSKEYIRRDQLSLQIELYKQELELHNTRRHRGVAAKCHNLKPLFKNYKSTISLRSVSVSPITHKDQLLVLQNDVNQYKLKIQELLIKNQELQVEINNRKKMCKVFKQNLQNLIDASKNDLEESINSLGLLRSELNETTLDVQNLEIELRSLQGNKQKLKAESLQLKEALKPFSVDNECYKSLSILHINYK